jgi:putative transposase
MSGFLEERFLDSASVGHTRDDATRRTTRSRRTDHRRGRASRREGTTLVVPTQRHQNKGLEPLGDVMAKPPRDHGSGGTNTYFITTSTSGGHALFQSARVAELFLTTLFSYRDRGMFRIHEFVLMPNHLHILLTPAPDITIERAVQFIKGGFSYRAGKELGMSREMWQRGYVDHRIRNAEGYSQHREYIRSNPVRAHLASAPEEYAKSSAFPGFALDPVPQGLKPHV